MQVAVRFKACGSGLRGATNIVQRHLLQNGSHPLLLGLPARAVGQHQLLLQTQQGKEGWTDSHNIGGMGTALCGIHDEEQTWSETGQTC